jgi:hypothetical protein
MKGIPPLRSNRSVMPTVPLSVTVSVRMRSETVSMSNGVVSSLKTLAVDTNVPSRRLRPSMLSKMTLLKLMPNEARPCPESNDRSVNSGPKLSLARMTVPSAGSRR